MAGNPVFVGGMYRSGTSLLRAMLGRHSRLFAGLETQWLYESWTNIATDRRRWLDRLSLFFDKPLDELESVCGAASNVEAALDMLMQWLVINAGKSRWVEKTPGNVGVIDRILEHWPEARVLHIIRDPRDVYASLVSNNKWAAPAEFVSRWVDTLSLARAWLAKQGGSHPAYYELRYERLVNAPEDEMRKVIAFLGEGWEPQVAEFSGQPEDFQRVRDATGKESSTLKQLAEPLTTARIGVWKDVFSAEQWKAVRAELACRGVLDLADTIMQETGTMMPDYVRTTRIKIQ